MKYTGCCYRESSRTNAPAMATPLIERYKIRGFVASGLLSIGGQERYFLNSSKVASHSDIHSKAFPFLRREKKGRAFRTDATINLKREAILPMRRCTSLTVVGLLISRIAQHLSGFVSIPRYVSTNPKNFPAATANTHLWGFNLILCCRRRPNTTLRSDRRLPSSLVLINISLM